MEVLTQRCWRLRVLDLSSNGLGGANADRLGDLRALPCLEHFRLRHNELDSGGVSSILHYFIEHTALKSLDFSENRDECSEVIEQSRAANGIRFEVIFGNLAAKPESKNSSVTSGSKNSAAKTETKTLAAEQQNTKMDAKISDPKAMSSNVDALSPPLIPGPRSYAGLLKHFEIWEFDTLTFLKSKVNAKDVGIWIRPLFLKRLQSDQPWSFFHPADNAGLSELHGIQFEQFYEAYEKAEKAKHTASARAIWKLILDLEAEAGFSICLYGSLKYQTEADAFTISHFSGLSASTGYYESLYRMSGLNYGNIPSDLQNYLGRSRPVREKIAMAKETKTSGSEDRKSSENANQSLVEFLGKCDDLIWNDMNLQLGLQIPLRRRPSTAMSLNSASFLIKNMNELVRMSNCPFITTELHDEAIRIVLGYPPLASLAPVTKTKAQVAIPAPIPVPATSLTKINGDDLIPKLSTVKSQLESLGLLDFTDGSFSDFQNPNSAPTDTKIIQPIFEVAREQFGQVNAEVTTPLDFVQEQIKLIKIAHHETVIAKRQLADALNETQSVRSHLTNEIISCQRQIAELKAQSKPENGLQYLEAIAGLAYWKRYGKFMGGELTDDFDHHFRIGGVTVPVCQACKSKSSADFEQWVRANAQSRVPILRGEPMPPESKSDQKSVCNHAEAKTNAKPRKQHPKQKTRAIENDHEDQESEASFSRRLWPTHAGLARDVIQTALKSTTGRWITRNHSCFGDRMPHWQVSDWSSVLEDRYFALSAAHNAFVIVTPIDNPPSARIDALWIAFDTDVHQLAAEKLLRAAAANLSMPPNRFLFSTADNQDLPPSTETFGRGNYEVIRLWFHEFRQGMDLTQYKFTEYEGTAFTDLANGQPVDPSFFPNEDLMRSVCNNRNPSSSDVWFAAVSAPYSERRLLALVGATAVQGKRCSISYKIHTRWCSEVGGEHAAHNMLNDTCLATACAL